MGGWLCWSRGRTWHDRGCVGVEEGHGMIVVDLVPRLLQVDELRILQEKTPKDLWKEDMDRFSEELDVSLHMLSSK